MSPMRFRCCRYRRSAFAHSSSARSTTSSSPELSSTKCSGVKYLIESLQNKPTQILVLAERVKLVFDVGGVDVDFAGLHVGGVEAEFFQEPLHDRVEPAGADVLGRLIHLEGIVRQGVDRVRGEMQHDPFGLHEGCVL